MRGPGQKIYRLPRIYRHRLPCAGPNLQVQRVEIISQHISAPPAVYICFTIPLYYSLKNIAPGINKLYESFKEDLYMTHEQNQQLLKTLHECMEACNHCFDACLKEDDVKMMADCIRTDRECADMCAFLEQAVTRNSPFVKELAGVCATICEACGKECQKHDHDHCQECAKACFECAEACRAAA